MGEHSASGWLPPSPSKAQPFDNTDREREVDVTMMARPVAGTPGEDVPSEEASSQAKQKAKQQDSVSGTARPGGSPLTFLLQKSHCSSLKTVPLSSLSLAT